MGVRMLCPHYFTKTSSSKLFNHFIIINFIEVTFILFLINLDLIRGQNRFGAVSFVVFEVTCFWHRVRAEIVVSVWFFVSWSHHFQLTLTLFRSNHLSLLLFQSKIWCFLTIFGRPMKRIILIKQIGLAAVLRCHWREFWIILSFWCYSYLIILRWITIDLQAFGALVLSFFSFSIGSFFLKSKAGNCSPMF